MRSQSNQFQKRLAEEMQGKKELELGLETRLNDMRRAIEQKQREIDTMANKMTLPIDTDIMRMKIQKDIEGRHRVEMEQKQYEVDRLGEQFYEAKRQLDVVKTQLDTQRHEFEKDVAELKEKGRKEASDLMVENQSLQAKADDKKDRELIRQLRRDLDTHKRKNQEIMSECTELRRERDLIKLEKNEQFVQFTKDLEEERGNKRNIQSELERNDFKMKHQQEDVQKMQLKLEKKQAELHRAHSDNNSKDQILRTREQMIESLQRQITQLKDDIRVKEVEIDSIQKRRAEDDRDREFMNREERSRAQKELDKCEKQIRELQTQKQIEYNTAQTKIENL